MKFSEAFYTRNKIVLPLEEIWHLYVQDTSKFTIQIAPYLMCPECNKVNLTFVNANPCYLRTLKNQKHDENCSLQQTPASERILTKYFEDTEHSDSIKRKLDAVLRIYIDKKMDPQPVYSTITSEDLSFVRQVKSGCSWQKYLPRKNIAFGVSDENLDQHKIFYGKVRLKWLDQSITQNWSQKYLNFFNSQTREPICSLIMSDAVYKYVLKTIPYKGSTRLYLVSFFCMLTKKGRYLNGFIPHSNYISALPFDENA